MTTFTMGEFDLEVRSYFFLPIYRYTLEFTTCTNVLEEKHGGDVQGIRILMAL